jgi:hypothetical protein
MNFHGNNPLSLIFEKELQKRIMNYHSQ